MELPELLVELSEVLVESSEESSEPESVVVVSLVVVILSVVLSLKKGSSPQEMMVNKIRNMVNMMSICFIVF